MARNLARAGFPLRAWNRARPLGDDGAELFEDPREAAAGAELVITMLSDADPVLRASPRTGGGHP